jgi:hypothetical protein
MQQVVDKIKLDLAREPHRAPAAKLSPEKKARIDNVVKKAIELLT